MPNRPESPVRSDNAQPRRWAWWASFAAAVAVMLVGAVAAYSHGVPALPLVRGMDKMLHFAMTALLSGLLDGALAGRGLAIEGRAAGVPASAVAILVPVSVEEYLQGFSSMRTASVEDWVADALGVVAGITVSRWARRVGSAPARGA